MWKCIAGFVCAAALTFAADYKVEPAGAPPAEAGAAAALLAKDGIKVLDGAGKAVAELWLRTELPGGAKNEENATFTTVPHGALLGVVRFPEAWQDRRGQQVKAGVYTLRFSLFPVNGEHVGISPQRDFGLLTPAAGDTDPNSTPDFEALMTMSRKASGTPHPAVFSLWNAGPSAKPGIEKAGEHDVVLHAKIGSTVIAIIIAGQHEG